MYTDKSLIGKTVIFKKDVKTASLLGPCNLLEGEEIEILKASERYANCYEVLSKSSKEKVWVHIADTDAGHFLTRQQIAEIFDQGRDRWNETLDELLQQQKFEDEIYVSEELIQKALADKEICDMWKNKIWEWTGYKEKINFGPIDIVVSLDTLGKAVAMLKLLNMSSAELGEFINEEGQLLNKLGKLDRQEKFEFEMKDYLKLKEHLEQYVQ